MILPASKIVDGAVLEADVCIAGAGPAGITIALQLLSTGKTIIMLAGGDYKETIESQDLHKGIAVPKQSHEPLEENRRRVYGGATTAWGGRCIPLDAIDFEARDWVKNSGWPFTYESLSTYYKKANELCKAGQFLYDSIDVFPGGQQEIIPGLDNGEIVSTKLERWSPPVDFGHEFHEILKNAENVTVLLNAHLTQINSAESSEQVSSFDVKAGSAKISIKAKEYIVACGGIENPRILLASKNKFYPNGIGNNHDVVGRYYMAHISGIFAELAPAKRSEIIFDFENDKEGVTCRRRWWITEQAQRNHKIGNVIFYLHRALDQDGHRDPLFSVVFIAKFVLSVARSKSLKNAKRKWATEKTAVNEHLKVIAKDGWSQIPRIVTLARKRMSKRRLPFVLPSVESPTLGLYFQAEQAPHRDCRITISNSETDALGMPRAEIHMNYDELDKKTIMDSHKIFIDRYKEQQLGNFKIDYKGLSDFIDKKLKNFNSGGHFLGTTRISTDPDTGVVDADCRVHGINNLYIAGGSVFPTGGHCNPTLTIVALAVKLAGHLEQKLNK